MAAERYDILTDEVRPLNREDWAVLNAVWQAYLKVRQVKKTALDLDELLDDLEKIHDELTAEVSQLRRPEE